MTDRRNSQRNMKPCVSCGDMTEWRCADCYIDKGYPVALCHLRECREKHETNGCPVTTLVEAGKTVAQRPIPSQQELIDDIQRELSDGDDPEVIITRIEWLLKRKDK